jgi:pimeloyl-ACP methyl ester carboxylesterase
MDIGRHGKDSPKLPIRPAGLARSRPGDAAQRDRDRRPVNRLIGWMRVLIFALALAAGAAGAAGATEVRTSHGGLTLRATLETAPGKSLADGLVILVHGTMGHRDMEVMRLFRRLLAERGHGTLAINLSLAVDARTGMFDCATPSRHRAEDTLAELDAWIEWAVRQGAGRLTVLGFSRGGQQAAWYAARQPHPRLARLVLLAPIFAGDPAAHYQTRFGTPLAPLLQRARTLDRQGRGGELLTGIGFLNCEQTSASARSFLSYYAPARDGEPLATLPRLKVPTLVVAAGGDTIVRDLPRRVAAAVDGKRIRLVVIDGADHFFRDLYGEDAADAIDAFLRD